jgi:hypothetical protein
MRTALSFTIAMLAAGCLREPAAPSFDEAAIDAACMDLAVQACALRERCSYMGYNVGRVYGDEMTCEARAGLTCINGLHVKDTSSSPDRTERCAGSYAGDSCSDYFDGNPTSSCAPLSGPGAIGSACTFDAQCSSSFCDVPQYQKCGTCQRAPDLGSPCIINSDCGRGIACAIPNGATMGSCAAYAAQSSPCLTGVVPCQVGLSCVGDVPAMSVMGTCLPAGNTLGAPCDSNRRVLPACNAAAGFYCTAATTGTCQAYVLAGPGEMCGSYVPTGSMQRIYAVCSGDGLCVKPPAASTGNCVAPAADGAPCDNDPTIGPPCLDPARCIAPAGMTAGTCQILDPAACF